MRTTLGVCAALLLGIGVAANVHAGPRAFGDGTLPSLLAVYDLDGNGILSQEERQAMNQTRTQLRDGLLAQWDCNGDGVLSTQEQTRARDTLRLQMESCRSNRFLEADTDGDGFLTFAEFSTLPAVVQLAEHNPDAPLTIFNGLDANDDNLVSLEEFLTHLRCEPQPTLEERFDAADVNDDQVLTFAEFAAMPCMVRLAEENPAAPQQIFDALDKDGNDLLTLAEFLAQRQHNADHDGLVDLFEAADANDDGYLTLAEFATVPPVARLAKDDPTAPQRIFDALDVDNDDRISPIEFLNLAGQLPMPPPGGGGGGGGP